MKGTRAQDRSNESCQIFPKDFHPNHRRDRTQHMKLGNQRIALSVKPTRIRGIAAASINQLQAPVLRITLIPGTNEYMHVLRRALDECGRQNTPAISLTLIHLQNTYEYRSGCTFQLFIGTGVKLHAMYCVSGELG